MKRITFTLLLMVLCAPAFATTEGGVGIVAVVNDRVITSRDLEQRLHFVAVTTGLEESPETRERMRPQVIRQMIDEELQKQDASRLNIKIDERDIDQAVISIETQRGMPPGSLLQDVMEHGITESYLRDQIKSQVLWSKMVSRVVRPGVKISDSELERARALTASGSGKESLISMLQLNIDTPDQEAQTKQLAEHLSRALQEGATFETVAKEIAPASHLVAPFWVGTQAMHPLVAKAVSTLSAGQISLPIRTDNGYVLVKLLDTRTTSAQAKSILELSVKLIRLQIPEATATDVITAATDAVKLQPGTCEDAAISAPLPEGIKAEATLVEQPLDQFSEALQPVLTSLAVGGISEPYNSDGATYMAQLCERTEQPPERAAKEETYARLVSEKLEMETRKYMRNLRKNAYIEIKK